jgi:hypothetical protein
MENALLSKTILINREWEIEARLLVEISSFRIECAEVEANKAPEEVELGIQVTNALKGMKGYIEGKKELNRLLEFPGGEMLKYLFNQCINGLIQAETYVYKERGFANREDYDVYWDKLEENGCRMYSHIDPKDCKWMDYVKPKEKQRNLFNRFKTYNIARNSEDKIVARASFSDSYHELNIEILFLEESGIVENCQICLSRAPGKACFENKCHETQLVGKNIYHLKKTDIIKLLGQSEGCYHLVDITADLLQAIIVDSV